MNGITKLESGSLLVRLFYFNRKPLVRQVFSVKNFKSCAELTRAAEGFVEEVKKVASSTGLRNYRMRSQASTRSQSSVLGVSKTCQKSSRSSSETLVWQASWIDRETGGQKNVSFSIPKWGEEGAFKRACKARKDGAFRPDNGAAELVSMAAKALFTQAMEQCDKRNSSL